MQLDLLRDAPTHQAATLPPGITARTLLHAPRMIMGAFAPDKYCEADADGHPFLCHHNIYRGVEYIGCLFRYAPDLPWIILSRGEGEPKTMGLAFDAALRSLIEWRDECDRKDKEMLERWRWMKNADEPKSVSKGLESDRTPGKK